MKKTISVEEAVKSKVEKAIEETKTGGGFTFKMDVNKPDYEFKYVLGKALREERVILMAKPDKYRCTGKTTMMTSAFYMKDDAYLVVSNDSMAKLYHPYIPKDRVLTISEIRRGFKGRMVKGGFILDEISYKDYQEVVQHILCPMGKVMGIVSIYKDYEIL